MNNEYVIFAINEIKKALDKNSDVIYVGDDTEGKYLCPMKSWKDYLQILKEFAIEEECYEQIKDILKLEKEVEKFINEKSQS